MSDLTERTPAHWRRVPLGHVLVERNEPTTAESDAPLSVTMQGVVDQLDDIAISYDGAPKKLALAGDLVINTRSDRKGASGRVFRRGSVSVINTVLKPRGVAPQFAHHLLRSKAFQEEFYRFGSGIVSDLWSTRYSSMRMIQLSLPPASEQRQIADFLDHEIAEIDAFIADLARLSQLETDRVRSDQELMIVSAAPPIAIRRLSPARVSGVSVNASQEPASVGQVGVLKTSAVSRGFFRPEENKAVLDPVEIGRLSAPVTSDRVLVNRANTPSMVGSAAYVESGHPDLFLSDKIWSIDFAADNEYVWRALQTRYYRDQVQLAAVGASTSMQNLGYEDFLSARLPVPDVSRQRQIVMRMRVSWDALGGSLADVDAAIALAKERRAAVITAAVTGQIDVTAKQTPTVVSIQSAIEEAR